MPWQEVDEDVAAVCFAVFIDQSGNASDIEPSFEWIWQKMPHGKDAASVLLSMSSTKHGYGQAWERSEPLMGLWAGTLVQWEGQHCSVASEPRSRPLCWAGRLGRRLAASSGMRDGRRPQECFPKRCSHLFLLGSSKPVLFCCWGWWWGMRKSCFAGVF